jgi:hypothetical protein
MPSLHRHFNSPLGALLLVLAPVLAGLPGCTISSVDNNGLNADTQAVASGTLTIRSSNWRYLVRGSAPVVLAGTGGPEDLLYHGARLTNGTRSGGDQQAIIDLLAANGGDALYVQAVKSHGGDGIAANGTYPACLDGSSCSWTANPFRYGNPAYAADPAILNQWYAWLSRADAAGIVTHFFLYDDNVCPWYGSVTGGRIRDRAGCRAETMLIPEENTRLITPVVNRLKSLKNLVWVVAEEYSEGITTPRARAIAARIRALDKNHAIAIHQLAGTTFEFAGDPNARVFHMQLGPGVNSLGLVHSSVVEAYDLAAGRYAVVLAEAAWHRTLVSAGDRTNLRKSNWLAAMAGAAGVLDYGMWEPTVPDPAMLGDLRRLKTFFETTNWSGMSNGDSYVAEATAYARYNPAGDFILYSDACMAGTRLGYTNVAPESDYAVEWFDAIDGSSSSETQHLVAGSNSFTVPAHVGGECGVWVHAPVPPG